MKRTIFIVLITASISAFAQERINITLQVEAPTLSDSESVYVAGNTLELGNWNPGKVILDNKNNKNWRKTIEVIKGTRLEYKFTKGNWQTEALHDDATLPQNSILMVERDTTVATVVNNWRDKFNFKVAGQITGKIEYHKNFVE